MSKILRVAVGDRANLAIDLTQAFLVGIDEIREMLVHERQQVIA